MIGGGRGRVRDYAAELVTIFAGIVLALVADAAWDFSSDRRREAEYLAGLRDELAVNAGDLAADQRVRTAALQSIAATLDAVRSGGTIPDDSVPGAIIALLNFRFFSPSTAVLDDLIDSGNLRVIRSDRLRFQLQHYRQQLEQLAVIEQRERDFIAESVEPWVATAVRMDDLLELRSYDEPVELPAADAAGFHAMARTDTFASLAFMRWERSRTAFMFGRGVGARIDLLIEILDSTVVRD